MMHQHILLVRKHKPLEMTPRSMDALRAIADHWRRHRQWPTLMEVMAIVGWKSKSTGWEYTDRLRRLGMLVREPRGAVRSTRISDAGWKHLSGTAQGTPCLCPCCGQEMAALCGSW